MKRTETILREIFASALKAADPFKSVARETERLRTMYGEGYSRLIVIGFGKAAVPMARAMEEYLGDIIDSGVVITKYGHGEGHGLEKIRVLEAGHPVPDANGMKGAAAVLELAAVADEGTMAVVLISGGGSALFASPANGVSLEDKQETTNLLLRAGADIGELNSVRKHISSVKGGRLAEILHPAAVVSLILSDVIGDRLDVIASGPTAPDTTTFGDALATLDKYSLTGLSPKPVVKFLDQGEKGRYPETPKEGDPVFKRVENVIIGSNRLALIAAREAAEARGIGAEILSAELSGEAAEAGRWLAGKALAARRKGGKRHPLCLISGGETTVTVTGAGKGGRNMELALAFAMEIEGTEGITLLSAGTDGGDGPTDAAGAVVDWTTVGRAREMGIDPRRYLAENDSYNFFRKSGGLLVTGPTGTNVMDIQIMVIR